jgi:outer membrane protein assembly complex protein YaeT
MSNIFSEENLDGKIIHNIIIKGIKKTPKKDITATMTVQEGNPFNMALVEQDYQNLMALDNFEEINISTGEARDQKTKSVIPDQIDLVFEFIEKPTIRKIIFRGNNNFGYGMILNELSIKRGEFVKKASIINDINSIKEKYNKKGYSYVEIQYQIFQDDSLKSKNQVDIIFNIKEGIETYVEKIEFNGNQKISEITLKGKMKTKERKYLGLQSGVFIESDFNQDMEDLKKYYKDQGFYFAELLEPSVTKYEKEENGKVREVIKISIQVKEGKQYRYDGLSIEGNKLFSYDDLTYNLKLRKGNIFNYSRYQEDKFAIQKKYTDSGYVETTIEETPVVNDENSMISFKLRITESSQSYIEGVYFTGNIKTKDYVLFRAVSTKTGEIFNSAKLFASYMSLYNLGFFSKVEYDIQPGTSKGLLKITYIVEEQSTAEIRFGLSISANKIPPDLTLFGELTEKNFLGREIVASAKVDGSLYKQGFTISLTDPWFFSYPISFGASAKFYHEWTTKVLKALTQDDINRYPSLYDPDNEYKIRDQFNTDYSNDDTNNPNYINGKGSDKQWYNMGMHDLNFELGSSIGYRFYRYFNVGSEYTLTPIYSYLPRDANNKTYASISELYYTSDKNLLVANYGWAIKSKLSTYFSIDTTTQRVNPIDGLKFSMSAAYTWGHFDSIALTSKFTYYWKLMDLSFNDWAFRNVLVFNMGVSFLFPGFRNLGGSLAANDPERNGVGIYKDTKDAGPILYSTDYLTVDGFFVGRGWGNSLGAQDYTGRLTDKRGYARFDMSLELRIPIQEKFVWLAAFIDMVNLLQGPSNPYYDYTYDKKNGELVYGDQWKWWSDPSWKSWQAATNNWYGSVGVGFEITLQQLPLSFYIVKRFKINPYMGIEWTNTSPVTGDLDFVLSIVGAYF